MAKVTNKNFSKLLKQSVKEATLEQRKEMLMEILLEEMEKEIDIRIKQKNCKHIWEQVNYKYIDGSRNLCNKCGAED